MNKQGISIIVLVVTIIVMIILATAVIITLTNNGIIGKTNEAKFKSDMKSAQEELNIYTASKILETKSSNVYYTKEDINSGTGEGKLDIKTIITNIKNEYENKLIVINGELYYIVNYKDEEDKKKGMWACQAGVIVEGYTNCEDILTGSGLDKRPTGKCNDVTKICEPDLTGFNAENTYYLTYDENGNEVLKGKISNKVPTDWYDYSDTAKKWANIKVINGKEQAYFVWIPRYEYKIIGGEDDTTPKQVLVNYITPNMILTEGYTLPAAFIWNMTDEEKGTKQLPGFWASKYEVANSSETGEIDFTYKAEKTSINITNIINSTIATTFEYWIGEEKKATTTNLTYEYMGLQRGTEYTVTIKAISATGDVIKSINKQIKTADNATYNEANAPDLTGFNSNNTYYVTFDASGNPIRGNKISGTAPSSWYNYGITENNKNWANIVTVNDNETPEDESDDILAYFVWIPRYEYYIYGGNTASTPKEVDVAFIPTSKVTPTHGYTIPAAFVWDMTDEGKGIKQLSGFWSSKYEITQ